MANLTNPDSETTVKSSKWENLSDVSEEESTSKVVNFENRSLSFQFPQGKTIEVDLVELKMLAEEYIGDKTKFVEYSIDIINMVKVEYDIEISTTVAWQLIQALELVWDEFKKKVVEPQTLLLSTI